jgi:hypothetical protein
MAPVRQKICVVGTWRDLPNVRNKNAPVILENKISCGLTVVCACSFRPSHVFCYWRPCSCPCPCCCWHPCCCMCFFCGWPFCYWRPCYCLDHAAAGTYAVACFSSVVGPTVTGDHAIALSILLLAPMLLHVFLLW